MSEDGVYPVYPEIMILKQEHDDSSETSSTTTTTTTTTTPPTPPTAPTPPASKKVRKVSTKGRNHHPLTSLSWSQNAAPE